MLNFNNCRSLLFTVKSWWQNTV